MGGGEEGINEGLFFGGKRFQRGGSFRWKYYSAEQKMPGRSFQAFDRLLAGYSAFLK
jgi:hypothetical protein